MATQLHHNYHHYFESGIKIHYTMYVIIIVVARLVTLS